jgi:hypothetical protein
VKPDKIIRCTLASITGPALLLPLFIAAIRVNAASGGTDSHFNLIANWLGFGFLFGLCLSFLNATIEEICWNRTSGSSTGSLAVAASTNRHRTIITKCAFMGMFYWLQFMFLNGGTDRVILCITMSMTFFLSVRAVLSSASRLS